MNRIFERKADIGIDMGNTNSYAWVSVGGRMRCVVAPNGGYHFPSYVYFRKDGSITVGSAAKRLFGSKTQSVVTNAMGLIGRMIVDVQLWRRREIQYSMSRVKTGL